MPTISPRVFISYRRANSRSTACHLRDRLAALFGEKDVFIDDDIPPGADFRQRLMTELQDRNVLLVLVGAHWLSGVTTDSVNRRIDEPADFVRAEILYALHHGMTVIPVLVDGACMPKDHQLPVDLKDFAYRQAVELWNGRQFANHVDRLFNVIGAALLQEEMGTTTAGAGENAEARLGDVERESLRKQLHDALEKRQFWPNACDICGDLEPVRCVDCRVCFTCQGIKPRWWRGVIFGNNGYHCDNCMSDAPMAS